MFKCSVQQYVAHGVAGRAAFGNNNACRGPVNVAVIQLRAVMARVGKQQILFQ